MRLVLTYMNGDFTNFMCRISLGNIMVICDDAINALCGHWGRVILILTCQCLQPSPCPLVAPQGFFGGALAVILPSPLLA